MTDRGMPYARTWTQSPGRIDSALCPYCGDGTFDMEGCADLDGCGLLGGEARAVYRCLACGRAWEASTVLEPVSREVYAI